MVRNVHLFCSYFFLNYIKSEFFIPAHVLKGNGADERGRPEQQQQQYQLAEQHISANVDLNASWKHRPPSQIPTTIKMKKHKNFWEICIVSFFFIQVIEPFFRDWYQNIFVSKLRYYRVFSKCILWTNSKK